MGVKRKSRNVNLSKGRQNILISSQNEKEMAWKYRELLIEIVSTK